MMRPASGLLTLSLLAMALVLGSCTSAPPELAAPTQIAMTAEIPGIAVPSPTVPTGSDGEGMTPAVAAKPSPVGADLPTPSPASDTAPSSTQGGNIEAVETCAVPLPQTPRNAEGPYYTPDAPFRVSLLEPDIPGERLVLSGRVLKTDCQPIPGAVLDFWQADGEGRYDNEGFKLRGRQEADAQGRYQLETVLPGEYPGRAVHIHVKVNAPGGPVLTTQIYFAGLAGNAADDLIDPALITPLLAGAGGGYAGNFDFVLAP